MATALLATSAPVESEAVAAGLGAFNTCTECPPSTNENGFSIANENSIFRGGIDLGGLLRFRAEFPGMYARSKQKGPNNISLTMRRFGREAKSKPFIQSALGLVQYVQMGYPRCAENGLRIQNMLVSRLGKLDPALANANRNPVVHTPTGIFVVSRRQMEMPGRGGFQK